MSERITVEAFEKMSNAGRAKLIRRAPARLDGITRMAPRAAETQAAEYSLGFYRFENSGTFFGYRLADGWYVGVLARGYHSRSGTAVFAIPPNGVLPIDSAKTIAYIRDGRCALGRHEWAEITPTVRQCEFCSCQQKLQESERVVIDRTWVDA